MDTELPEELFLPGNTIDLPSNSVFSDFKIVQKRKVLPYVGTRDACNLAPAPMGPKIVKLMVPNVDFS